MHSNGGGLPHLFRVGNPLPDCKLKLHPVVVKKGGVQTSDEVPLHGAEFTNPLGRLCRLTASLGRSAMFLDSVRGEHQMWKLEGRAAFGLQKCIGGSARKLAM